MRIHVVSAGVTSLLGSVNEARLVIVKQSLNGVLVAGRCQGWCSASPSRGSSTSTSTASSAHLLAAPAPYRASASTTATLTDTRSASCCTWAASCLPLCWLEGCVVARSSLSRVKIARWQCCASLLCRYLSFCFCLHTSRQRVGYVWDA